MATGTENTAHSGHASKGTASETGDALVDSRAPRFGQALTTLGLVTAVVFQEPALVYLVAALLIVAVVSGWRIDLYAWLWRRVVSRVVDPPTEREPATPHRFARLVGAVLTGVASLALLAGASTAGYLLLGFVALLAGLAATTGFCLGCRMYRQVHTFQRLGLLS